MNEAEIWPGERLIAERLALGYTQEDLSKAARPTRREGPSETVVCWWENGVKPPSVKHAQRVQGTIERIKILGERGFDVSDVRRIRRQLRLMGDGATPIPQSHGRAFIAEFCERVGLKPTEFVAAAQLRATVVRAALISAPAQRWVGAWAAGIEKELGGNTFGEFAKAFSDRNAALAEMANRVFAALLAEVGKEKVMSYIAALVVTGEIRQAPTDLEVN
jgi:hypothetical protein